MSKLKVHDGDGVTIHDDSVGTLLLHFSGVGIHIKDGALVVEGIARGKPFRHLGVGESLAQQTHDALLVEFLVV